MKIFDNIVHLLELQVHLLELQNCDRKVTHQVKAPLEQP